MDLLGILGIAIPSRLRRVLGRRVRGMPRDANRQICSDLLDETETRSSGESRRCGAPREIGRAARREAFRNAIVGIEDWHGILEVDGKPVTSPEVTLCDFIATSGRLLSSPQRRKRAALLLEPTRVAFVAYDADGARLRLR